MFHEFLKSMFLIFMAEMGDKTQILAMAFATRFKIKLVLAGIFIGSLLNHGLAVILGAYLSKVIPIDAIQIIAGFSFIGFALWTLRSEEEEEEEEKKENFGPVLTVAVAFFIGELGDKTQLTAITLAADASFPLFVLMGTVSGMIITGALGIIVGSKLGKRVPEFTIKMASASIFMFFGITKLLTVLPKRVLTVTNMLIFFVVLGASVWFILKPTLKMRKEGKLSAFREKSKELYEFYNQINERVEELCLGEASCGKCSGKNCMIGYTKNILKDVKEGNDSVLMRSFEIENAAIKNYDREKVLESLSMIIAFSANNSSLSGQGNPVHRLRQVFETILFKKTISQVRDLNSYFKEMATLNQSTADVVSSKVAVLLKDNYNLKIS